MKCSECPYYWKDEDERYSRCHFDDSSINTVFGTAPCEEEDVE